MRTPALSPWRLARRLLLILAVLTTTGPLSEAAPAVRSADLPLMFEVNQGQAPPSVDFVARGSGYHVYLAGPEVTIVLSPARPAIRGSQARPVAGPAPGRTAIRMAFAGASAQVPAPTGPPAGHVHYVVGSAPSHWLRHVPTLARVFYPDLYPGIDVVYYGNARRLEYDLIVRPGADPGAIAIALDGLAAGPGGAARLDPASGDLVLATPAGDIRLRRPTVYQDIGGARRLVEARYVVRSVGAGRDGASGAEIGFHLGSWDRSRPLVIDPVLDYGTYLGGTGSDVATAVAVDASGHAYLTGYTDSLDVPGPAGFSTPRAGLDAFVTKIDPTGAPVFTVYLGGTGDDGGMGLAVDGTGQVYVAGFTESSDFPVVNGYHGDRGGTDAFLAKLSAAGTELLYSTYLGGSDVDMALAVAVNDAGHAHVTGYSASADFPRVQQVQGSRPYTNAFVAKFDTTRTGAASVVYSTGLGGDGEDEGHGIALDAAGNAHVVGWTDSTNFPRVNSYSGDRAGRDGFLTVLPPGGGGLLYSTYIAAIGQDMAFAVAVDAEGRAWVTGSTDSGNFMASSGAYQRTLAGGTDAFVSVFDPTRVGLDSLVASTLYGGTGDDQGVAIVLDPVTAHAVVAGTTTSADLPTRNALHGLRGGRDAFVLQIDPFAPAATALRFASHLGGSGDDEAGGVAVDAAGAVYVAGASSSPDFPTRNPITADPPGSDDGFLVKLSRLDEPGMDLAVTALTVSGPPGEDGMLVLDDTVASLGAGGVPASTLRLYLSVDDTLDETDIALTTRAVPALAAGESSSGSTAVTLPPVVGPGLYHVLAQADADDEVGEPDEANNIRASARIVVGVDLHVASVSVPAAAAAGSIVGVSTVVANQGGRAAGGSTLKLYLSADSVLDPGDLLLGNRAEGPLGPGASSTATTAVTIPPTTAAGVYRVIAVADADGTVTEADESNNATVSQPVALGADLAVGHLSLPTIVAPGAQVTVTDTTRNQGAAPAGSSQTRFYLSYDTTLDASDEWLTSRTVPPLGPGESSQGSTSVAIPASATLPFYIIAQANGSGAVAESHADNNTRLSLPISPGGDLAAWLELPAGSGRVAAGGTITVTEYTKNLGVLPAPATATRIYLSADMALDAGDRVLGSRAIPALAPGALDSTGTTVTIPADVTGGTWYVLIKADADGVFAEVDETNNFTPPARQVVVGADLVVGLDVPGSATWLDVGASVTVSDLTRNNSPVPAGASVNHFYLSTDAALDAADVLLGTRAVPALAADSGNTATTTLTMPAATVGRFRLIARANADGAVVEVDTTNNTSVSLPISIGPDLAIFFDVPGSATVVAPGATITVSDTVHNGAPSPVGATVTRFFLSSDATLDAADTVLGTRSVPALGGNAQSTGSTALTLSAALPAGTYHLFARADADGAVLELDETNNVAGPKTITVGTDLTAWVELPAGSGRVAAGGSAAVNVSTKNLGAVAAPATTTRIYASTDPLLDAADVVLGQRSVGPLGPGGEDVASVTVTFPPTLAGGTYYVLVKADADNVLTETDETNNFREPARQVLVGADLTVGLDVPGSAAWVAPGATITVSDATRNRSSVPAGASLTRFYLSADAALDAADLVLAERAVPALAPDTEHRASTTLTLPATAVGRFHLIARANADGAVGELDAANNASTPVPVAVGPDLSIYFDVPGSAAVVPPGATITATDVVHNTAPSPAGATVTRFYLSSDTVLDAADTVLGARSVPALGPNAQSAGSTALTLPATLPGGTYYLFARADADAAVPEVDETNNVAGPKTITVGTDLVAWVALPASSGRVAAGGTLTADVYTKNLGGVAAAATRTAIYLSTDAVLDAGDAVLGHRAVGALGAGGEDFASVSVPVPASVAGGTYYVLVKADADNAVTETDETNNFREPARQVLVGADLTVGLDVPGSAAWVAPGATITVSDATRNRSSVPAGASLTRFYLSADAVLDAADLVLAERAVPALAPDTEHRASTTLTLPATAVGRFHLIARANADGAVGELDAANNASTPVPVAVGPDLSIYFDVPGSAATVAAGATITVSDVIHNITPSPAGATVTRFYLSSDAVLDAADTVLGTRSIPALGPNAQSAGSTALTLPAQLAAGTYHLFARADADGVVPEVDETNNVAGPRTITIGADLTAWVGLAPGSTRAAAGGNITAEVYTKNLGGVTAPATATRVYLSSDATLDAGDIVLGSRPVAALPGGGEDFALLSLTIPATLPGGTYYVLVQADADNAATETSESNNFTPPARAVLVGADLVVSLDLPGSATVLAAGATFTLTDTTRNASPVPAGASVTRFYLSRDTALDAGDVLLGSRAVPALAADTASTASTALALPPGAGGVYYVVAVADAGSEVAEVNEANNQAVSRDIQVGVDLVVFIDVAGASSSVEDGATITVTDHTRNEGMGVAPPSTTSFYLSASGVPGQGDILLGSRAVPGLAAGEVSTSVNALALPSGLQGTYYVMARADAGGVVPETSEVNNVRVSSTTIAIGPDLTISGITVPARAAGGSIVSISDVTKNRGRGAAQASMTGIYLSVDGRLGPRAMRIALRPVPALAPGAWHAATTQVLIPGTVLPGVYHVIVAADSPGEIAEGDETNNVQLQAIEVLSDLRLTALSGPSKAYPGSTITVTDTTRNTGAPAPATTTALYLSADSVLDATDVLLGVRSVPALAFGAEHQEALAATLPASLAAGTWYLIAAADAGSEVNEVSETNNIRARAIAIGPDLVVSSVSAPGSAASGGTIVVDAQVANLGSAAAASTTAIYLSTDKTLSGGDVLVGSAAAPALAFGATASVAVTVTIPGTTAAGSYHLIAVADSGNAVVEITETNNAKTRAVTITAP